jgi:hypothetical protein
MKSVSAVDKKALEKYLERLKDISDITSVDVNESASVKKARIERAKKDYNFYVRYYFPHYAETDCAPFHIEEANRVLKFKDIKAIEEWARGHAKSTHFDIFIPLWLHLFHDQLKCMLLVGKNLDSAKKLLSDLQAECEANKKLIHDFGPLVLNGSWEEGNFKTTTGAAFFALGKGQSPRGLRNGPNRPDYIVVDDVDDDEECRNPRRVDQTVEWIRKALIPAMGKDITRFILVNNRIAKYSVLAKLAENKNFYHRRINALDENGRPSWSARYTKEHFDAIIKIIGWVAFNTEYMNEPMAEGKIFIDKYFQWCPILPLSMYDRIVAYWDVAYSEAKTADCNAVVIVGLTGVHKHVLRVYCRQSKMEDAIRWMSAIKKRLKQTHIEWYGESQFWNSSVDLALKTVAKEFGFRMPIIFLDRPGRGSNKYSRIIQMLPAFQRGEMYFNEKEKHNQDMQTLVEQTKGIEPGYKTHDDGPDALEGASTKLEVGISVQDSTPTLGDRPVSKRLY